MKKLNRVASLVTVAAVATVASSSAFCQAIDNWRSHRRHPSGRTAPTNTAGATTTDAGYRRHRVAMAKSRRHRSLRRLRRRHRPAPPPRRLPPPPPPPLRCEARRSPSRLMRSLTSIGRLSRLRGMAKLDDLVSKTKSIALKSSSPSVTPTRSATMHATRRCPSSAKPSRPTAR